ncbi:MAG: VOC family protein [Actinobacteria bacterium]|nr:MAG: VOC family protein [Actinomycetota bacterium]
METSIAPLLTVSDAEAAADFYKLAFRATEVARHDAGEHRIVVEMEIAGAPFVIVDENPAAFNLSPQSLNGTSVRISLLVDDPDAVFERALKSGGKKLFPMADQPYGLRQGRVEDPFGHHWMVSKPLSG